MYSKFNQSLPATYGDDRAQSYHTRYTIDIEKMAMNVLRDPLKTLKFFHFLHFGQTC